MHLLDLAALLAFLIATLAFVNARYLRLPSTIGVTIAGLAVSLVMLGLAELRVPLALDAVELVRGIDFDAVVFLGVLSFLLFAGALGLDSHELWQLRWPVLVFSLLATAISIVLVGGLSYGLLALFGLDVSFLHCLLFGALISPTDPVAVLGMLKHAKVPPRIETLVAGESLFNDGIGVVAFTVIAAAATGDASAGGGAVAGPGQVGLFFLQEAVGGLLLGVVLGYAGLIGIRLVEDVVTEVMISLGVVLVLTAVAVHLHVSGPLAAVAAGLLVGSLTDRKPSVLTSRERFEEVWHLIDEVLNVVLFALLALEIVAVAFELRWIVIGLITIPLVLFARTVSVQGSTLFLRRRVFDPYTRRLMVWGGLRGALGVAMAFTLPDGAPRELFLVMTYCVVVFSIVVQGLTVGRLAARAAGAAAPAGSAEADAGPDHASTK
ncbi:MAG: sodium:proton antiporter [Kineosporiaceae bacterium]